MTEDTAERPIQKKEHEGFSWFVKGLLVVDCMLLLFLTFGYLLPAKPLCDPDTGGLRADLYDDSAKLSPFASPVVEPARVKVEIPRITARGDNPTFVPAAEASSDVSQSSFDDSHDLSVVPVSDSRPSLTHEDDEGAPARVQSASLPHTS